MSTSSSDGLLRNSSLHAPSYDAKFSFALVKSPGAAEECYCFLEMAPRQRVQYSRLSSEEQDGDSGSTEEKDLRFSYAPRSLDRIPWKSIALALFLLSLGCLLLFLCFFILMGHMGGDHSQAYGFLVLGILAFLPGFYETRIAYYSWRGARGYRFASIPDY